MEQQQSSAGEEINQPYSHFEKMNPSFFRKYIVCYSCKTIIYLGSFSSANRSIIAERGIMRFGWCPFCK